ncbi:MAG: hypothetical protein R2851_21940 [Caldilineaceae bacterium]
MQRTARPTQLPPESAAEVELPACPAEFADYPETIDTLLNTPGASVDTLNAFLAACSDAGRRRHRSGSHRRRAG